MQNKGLCELVAGWEQAIRCILCEKTIKINDIEHLFKETYRISAMYYNKEMVPKEMMKLFDNISHFMDWVLADYGVDELSTPSDCAVFNAIGSVIDAIKEGFYSDENECSYPNLWVSDYNGILHSVNLEGAFLEFLIDANR